ncbi:AraC family transcriptional regulator [alpha proteobacterium AAP81b]|nr:AraC family transcriptional regulator [alpha proteobacterium AAP81b]
MELMQLDVAIRIAAATTLLLLAWLLFRQARRIGLPALLFLPLAICVAGFAIGNAPAAAPRPAGALGSIAHFVSGFTVIFLWWFCLACFDRRFRPRGGVLAGGLLWAALAAGDRGLFGEVLAGKGLSYALVAMGFAIVGHLVWRLLAERAGDLVEQRRDARILVAVFLGGMLLIDLAADALFGLAWRPLPFAMVQNAAILAFGLWLAGRLLGVRADVLAFGAAPATTAAAGDPRDAELRRRLACLIETQRIFLDPELSFAGFVERMAAPERAVRRLVNHELGFDHFRAFLNHYRVVEARRRLADPRHADDKLIAIALDSGFASLASFNRVFRAAEGCSPGQYRARHDGAKAGDPAGVAALPVFEPRKAAF